VSAMPNFVAPASAAASKISRMSSMGVLEPSLRTKLTVAPCFFACSMASTVFFSACCFVVLRRYWRLRPLIGVSIVISFIPLSRHASTLVLVGSAEALILALVKVSFTSFLTLRLTSSESPGKPTFITAMPISSMSLASLTCSTYVRNTVGVLIPSRKVSSWMKTLSGRCGGRFFLRRL